MSKKSSTFVVDFANKRLRCYATRMVFGKSPLRLKWHFNRFNLKGESVAQQVEHIPFKDGVLGSSPSWFTSSETSLLFFVPLFHTSFLCTSFVHRTSVLRTLI